MGYPKNYLFYYFLYNQTGGNKKWDTLSHNGVIFPPKYIKHNTPIIYEGNKIILEEEAEEAATFYAKYIDTKYIKSRIFRNNFWLDWKKRLGKNHIITSLDKCDFSLIYEYIIKQKERKMTPEEKEERNKIKISENDIYGYAIVDGKKQPIMNFRIEPPGIYLGRGCNPRLGKIKDRIYPEDIIINIGKDAIIPKALSGHSWGKVIHDNTVEWLASWKDNVSGKIKYVWLSAKSELSMKKERDKFDKARKLKKRIGQIRSKYYEDMKSDDIKLSQMATALYLIDNFALRVGTEKTEEEADTVGVSSLRKEHLKLLDNNVIELDFLSKDSVRYHREQTVDNLVYKNIRKYVENKSMDEEVFDRFKPQDLNEYLKQFMKNLTTKVFRTYNASNLFQKEINKINKKYEGKELNEAEKINILLNEFNKANLRVAIMCNHQKEVSKNFNDQIKKINEKIKILKEKKRKAKKKEQKLKIDKKINNWKAKKVLKIELKNYSLGTSKINYIDPRITVAFIKKNKIPINKIFTKTLQGKFEWALDISEDYVF